MATSQTPGPPDRCAACGEPLPVCGTKLLTPAEMAATFRVDPKTVTRWANHGQLPEEAILRTAGGHRRYRRDVLARLYPGVFPPADGGGAE